MKIRFFVIISALLMIGSISFAAGVFNTDKLNTGIVGVTFQDTANDVYKVLIQKGNDTNARVSYPFFANGQTEFFPLTLGKGDYMVALMKGVGGGKWAILDRTTVTLQVEDESVIYLNSIQNVKWSAQDQPIKYAFNLAKDVKTAEAAFDLFYKYITENVVYDFNKAATVQSDYIPSISKTFVDSKGICYDYSSMLAAFMRSLGFPARLVKGYPTTVEGYHAWNEILINGQWMIVDTTYDAGMKKYDVKFKPAENYKNKVHQY